MSAAVALTVGRISGSSIGVIAAGAPDPALLWGTPRPIRGDEWINRTPTLLNQVVNGSPPVANLGVGGHNLTVLGDQPTSNWPILFRPDNLPALWLDPDRALAWSWWSLTAIAILGVFALVLRITHRVWIAAAIGLLVGLSPHMEWWHLDISLGTVGFTSAAGAAYLSALRARGPMRAAGWALAAAYGAVASVLTFYPPWLIPALLVVGALSAAMALGWWRDGVVSAARALACSAAVLAIAGGVLAWFVHDFGAVLSAITNTSYPGQRRTPGGGGSLAQLLSAPFSSTIGRVEWPKTTGVNESEISAPYLLVLPALALAPRLLRSSQPRAVRYAAVALLATAVALLAWTLLPIPASAGRFLLLDQVPGFRSVLGIGLAGALLLALGLAFAQGPARWWVVVAVAGIGFAGQVAGGWLIRTFNPNLPWSGLLVGATAWALLAAVLVLGRRWLVVPAAALAGVLTLATVNPGYVGIGVLDNAPLVEAVRSADSLGPARWVTYTDSEVTAMVVSTGVPAVTAVNWYPNAQGWAALLGPSEAARTREIWNRYSNQLWNNGGDDPTVQLIQADAVNVGVSPCSPRLAELGIGYAVWPTATPAPDCMVLLTTAVQRDREYGVYALRATRSETPPS